MSARASGSLWLTSLRSAHERPGPSRLPTLTGLLTGGKVHGLGTIGGGFGSQAAVVVSVLVTAVAFAALSGGLGN